MSLTQTIEKKVARMAKAASWHLVGKNKYLSRQPFLTVPSTSTNLDNQKKSYYDDGIVKFPQASLNSQESQELLAIIKNDFKEAIDIFNNMPKDGTGKFHRDSKNREWYINPGEGVIHLIHEDRQHPIYTASLGQKRVAYAHEQNFAQLKDLFINYPLIKRIVDNPQLRDLAGYANRDANPIVIKIERKTTTLVKGYNQIHIDTVDTSTFKSYLYLNDVDENTGAFSVSAGSHHWANYPKLLNDIFARQKKWFKPEDIASYGLKPLEKICFKAGTLFCFTGNAVHTATNVANGLERWTIQFYYYTRDIWSTDKRV